MVMLSHYFKSANRASSQNYSTVWPPGLEAALHTEHATQLAAYHAGAFVSSDKPRTSHTSSFSRREQEGSAAISLTTNAFRLHSAHHWTVYAHSVQVGRLKQPGISPQVEDAFVQYEHVVTEGPSQSQPQQPTLFDLPENAAPFIYDGGAATDKKWPHWLYSSKQLTQKNFPWLLHCPASEQHQVQIRFVDRCEPEDPKVQDLDKELLRAILSGSGVDEAMAGIASSITRNKGEQLMMWLDLPGVEDLHAFRAKLDATDGKKWGFEISEELVRCSGRLLPKQKLLTAGGTEVTPDDDNSWTSALVEGAGPAMLAGVDLDRWAIVVSDGDGQVEHVGLELLPAMRGASEQVGFKMAAPSPILKVIEPSTAGILAALDNLMDRPVRFQLILVVLGQAEESDLRAAVAHKLTVQHGVPFHFYKPQHVNSEAQVNSAMVRRLLIDINVKIGGEPWRLTSCPSPFKNQSLMIVGFDLDSVVGVCATVASVNQTLTKYCSTVDRIELGANTTHFVQAAMVKCLDFYRMENGDLPDRIILYRDGVVGPTEMSRVLHEEVGQVKELLAKAYVYVEAPKFSFIVLSRKPSTRFFVTVTEEAAAAAAGAASAAPLQLLLPVPAGTVVDEIITFDNQHDFYLMSGSGGDRTPVSYNILHNTLGLDKQALERATFAFCHLGFDHFGSLASPAPSHYATKLVANYHGPPHRNLATALHLLF